MVINNMKKLIYRIFQFLVKIGVSVITWKTEEVISGKGVLQELPDILIKKKAQKVFLITDPYIYSLGLCNDLEQALKLVK